MSTLGVIALVTWLVGGLAVGVTAEVLWPIHDGPAARGLRVLVGWMGAIRELEDETGMGS